MSVPQCMIDQNILNVDTLPMMTDIALSFFASSCGKNRGAFVLDPPDGHTYSCLNFPEDIAELSGIDDMSSNVTIKDANAIKEQYVGGSITASQALSMLDFLVQAVYHSTPNKATSPYACEFNGLAELDCDDIRKMNGPRSDGSPIRAVSLAGLFVDAFWATGGKPLSVDEASEWYTLQDFQDIKSLGLNTVQITVPASTFVPDDEVGYKIKKALKRLLGDIETAGLQAILALVATGDEEDPVVAAASYAYSHPTVLAVALPSKMLVDTTVLIDKIRVEAPTLPIFIPINEGDITKTNGESDPNVYASLEMSHISTVADIASSGSREDRSKLFYHEATSCMVRSPLEFSACFQKMPIFLSSGFDLSIDDCFNKGISADFKDYGQCDRFEETINSAWWHRHRQSFAARQMFAYERGLGWSFATWKLYKNDNVGVIDSPAKLLALQDVAAAGLFPDISSGDIPAQTACLNPPENDFVLGDETLAPTMGPPPDCGPGWWNYTTSKCDYWIPPPKPSPAPSASCPICEECSTPSPTVTVTQMMMIPSDHRTKVIETVVGSALVGALIAVIIMKIFGKNRRDEYTAIPN